MAFSTMAELFFGDFRFDTRRLHLEGPEAVVEVRAKTLELLVYLIQHRNRFVPRAELMDSLWPGVTVTPSSLTQCVSELRQALGDSARAPRYVETRVKLGYRFIATVYHRPTEQLVPLPPPDDEAPRPVVMTRARRGWVAATVLLAAMAVLAWALVNPSSFRDDRRRAPAVLVVVRADTFEDATSPLHRITTAAHDEILRRLAGLEGVGVTTDPRVLGVAADLELELAAGRCRRGGFELHTSLRRVDSSQVSWGWTFSFSNGDTDTAAVVEEVGSRVAAAVRSRALAPE